MKTNEYLQKYGQKALQLLNKKSQKQTIVSDININVVSDNEHPAQPTEKAEKKSSLLKNQKSQSNKSLCRNSKSKSKITINGILNQNQYTFQKPLNLLGIPDKGKDRKKLMISGLSTPKNNRSARMPSNLQQKPQSSSTKKKATDIRISQKLNQALSKHKTPKSLIKQLLECLDIISTHEYKITKWVSQFKQILYNIAEQATTYRRKYKQQVLKNKKINKQMQQLNSSIKINGEKKRKNIEVVIMQQNSKLRQKIEKLQTKIQNYQKKQIILIETLQKLRVGGVVKPGQQETNSSSKKQIGYVSTKIKKQFYGNLEEDQQEEQQQQSDEGFRENQ